MPRNLASPQSRCLVFNMLAYHGGCKLKSPKGGMNRAVTRFKVGKRNILWVLDVLVIKRQSVLLPK